MDGQIFISYRRDDSSGSTGRLYDHLNSHFAPNQIFMDVDSLQLGIDFVKAIEKNVASSDVLIAVIGKYWLTLSNEEGQRRLDSPEDFVRIELATALKSNIRVIPVLVDGASIPKPRDMPDELKEFVRRNAFEVRHARFKDDCERLVAAVERALEEAAAEQRLRPKVRLQERSELTPPSDKIIRALVTEYLEDFWVKHHAVERHARKSATLDSYRLGKVQPFNPAQHARLKQVDWGTPVYPLEVEYTLVDKHGAVERMASDYVCYVDAFGKWRCSGVSVLPRRIG